MHLKRDNSLLIKEFKNGIKYSGLTQYNSYRKLMSPNYNPEILKSISMNFINMAQDKNVNFKDIARYQNQMVLIGWNNYTFLIANQYKNLAQICLIFLCLFWFSGFVMKYFVSRNVIKPAIYQLHNLKKETNKKTEYIEKNSRFVSQGENLAHINHNMNNLLSVISLNSMLLLKKIPQDDESLNKIASRYKEGMDSLILLSKALRDVVKGSHDIKEEISLQEILDNIKLILADKAERHKTILNFNLENDILLNSNRNNIYQIFFNLISNAIDAQSKSNKNWVNISVKKEKESYHIFVKDSGNGIPLEERKKIFKDFHTTKENGTGLGLSYVKKVLKENMASDIEYVENEKNTTFKIKLSKDLII